MTILALAARWLIARWRGTVVVLALLALAGTTVSALHRYRDAAKMAQKAEDDAAQLHKDLRVIDSIRKADAVALADALRQLEQAKAPLVRYLTRTDTLERWRHDTTYVAGVPSFTVPVSDVAQADSGKQACVEYLNACDLFKRQALATFHSDSTTIRTLEARLAERTQPVTITRTSFKAKLGYTLLGALLAGTTAEIAHHGR